MMENLTLENLDRFHDAVYDSTNINLPKDSLVVAFNFLPTEIKNIAEEWGYNDTEFGNKVYEFFKVPENKEQIQNLIDQL
ncbi:hypothetical protein [Chryseobacterium proteolyticum]|uniref:hypothetical protein n=1 Tax=Chryseobacterium proteolyticum TaxID=118127 RepID=UPI0027A0D58B|nr:hypothetical protein PFY10_00605 [Chryseobacterium daecheongense]